MDCINLKERFGDRFKVDYEESYYAERSIRSVEDPWLMILLCQRGHICPWGGSTLAACTKGAGSAAKRLKALPFVEVAQDGRDGTNVLFDVRDFDAVAKIMHPRRRRRLSEEQKRQSAKRLRKYQFAKGQEDRGPARQAYSEDETGLPSTCPG